MNPVGRSVPGLRDSMFDVLDQLRNGKITHRAARVQMEAAKTICLTVHSEHRELQVIQKQIEVEDQLKRIEDQRVIEHVG